MKKKIGWILVLAVALLACIGAALAFFWPENSAPTISMTRVGSFQTQVPMEDTIALPSALEGSGIHVLDGQGESRPAARGFRCCAVGG